MTADGMPDGFTGLDIAAGPVRLHVAHNARGVTPDGRLDDPRPALLMLHGFPEYRAGWADVAARLADRFLILLPDQRGYGLSDAPAAREAYRAGVLVGDMLALLEALLGSRRVLLCGHDWGASVAYALAFAAPERLAGLVIANGVHPVLFQHALIHDAAQGEASRYIDVLRAPDAEARLSRDDYRPLFGMFERFSDAPWLTPARHAAYREAWSRPGRLTGMLNWYRASPLVVPRPGETPEPPPILAMPEERFAVRVPHLLIWGTDDQALRPASHAGLERFAPDLTRIEVPGTGHWLLHSHPDEAAAAIAGFADRLAF